MHLDEALVACQVYYVV